MGVGALPLSTPDPARFRSGPAARDNARPRPRREALGPPQAAARGSGRSPVSTLDPTRARSGPAARDNARPRPRRGALGPPQAAAWGSGRSPSLLRTRPEPDRVRRRATMRARGCGVGLSGPHKRPRGVRGEAPSLLWTRPGPDRVRRRATMRARREALGPPQAAARGSGRSPVSTLDPTRARSGPAARDNAARGRGVGLSGPHKQPRGVRGEAPSLLWTRPEPDRVRRRATMRARGRGVGLSGPHKRPRGVRGEAPLYSGPDPSPIGSGGARQCAPAAAAWGSRAPTSGRVGFGAKPLSTPDPTRARSGPAARDNARPRRGALGPPQAAAWGSGRSPDNIRRSPSADGRHTFARRPDRPARPHRDTPRSLR